MNKANIEYKFSYEDENTYTAIVGKITDEQVSELKSLLEKFGEDNQVPRRVRAL